MQDDVDLIVGDGWFGAAQPRGVVEDRERKLKETPDLVVTRRKYKLDLIPPALVVARYFAAEQQDIEILQLKRDTATRELEEFIREHTGKEGLLEDAVNDKGEVVKARVTARLGAILAEPDSNDERKTLQHYVALVKAESKASKAVKEAQATRMHRSLPATGSSATVRSRASSSKTSGSRTSAPPSRPKWSVSPGTSPPAYRRSTSATHGRCRNWSATWKHAAPRSSGTPPGWN